MKDIIQRLKIFMAVFKQSPLNALADVGRRLFSKVKVPAQVGRLQKITREAPLILQIETVNVCNAVCAFCAYSSMKRKKGVMSLPLFEKIVKDYADMGGGAVSLTPVVGDALLDPHLMDRLRILEAHPEINQISLTTNAIALDRYSDEDVSLLLKTLFCLQVSIGGLDAETYKLMYGVDRFAQVQQAMERLLRLREKISRPANLTFAFRTNDWKFETRFKQQLDEYRRRGAFVSHLWTFANYSGLVQNNEKLNLVVHKSQVNKCRTCIFPSFHMAVCWDGTITACACTDLEGNRLMIGHAEKDTLAEVWFGKKRAGILDSFTNGTLSKICRQCSSYQRDTNFAQPYFNDVRPHQPLPLDFFHHMMT